MKTLLIFLLTNNDRYFTFDKLILEINKSLYKKNIFLLIVNSVNSFDYYIKQLDGSDILHKLSFVECPKHNYLPKVRHAISFAIKNKYDYIMKCDNDMIIPSYTLNSIYENLKYLDNPDNLTLSPTISTGIPSCEYFIDDFLNDNEAKEVRNEFKKCQFNKMKMIMDYTPLNKCTILDEKEWNYNDFYSYLDTYVDGLKYEKNDRTNLGYCKHYKGIHPIRYGYGNDKLNDLIIKNKEKFFLKNKYDIIIDDKPYLCNMCFVIKTDNYDKLMNKENLIIDGCDEVPLNRFRRKYNLNHLIIRYGYAIHITYNLKWYFNSSNGGYIETPNLNLGEYEKKFVELLYK
jgi:hypothetical protein